MGSSGKVLNLKTLIVEDNASFREVLKEKLRTFSPSMEVYEAAEGNEALQKVDALKPDLVFMDIRLPGDNGLQLTQKIKARYPHTKIIVLTNYDSLEYREAAIRSGGDCYVDKDSLNYVQIGNLIKSLVE
jgi:DNA-binding NarL/FixJ family response regulator